MQEKFEFQASHLSHSHPDVYGAEREMSLFYDESNNIRKLCLRENGLNVKEHENFVLGGIMLLPGQSIGDIHELRSVLQISPKAKEIKFEMIAKGEFEKMLGSPKLTKILKWLTDKNIGIHYTNVNVLHWTILDIIESIVAHEKFRDILPLQHELKNELYRLANTDLKKFLSILHTYGFPDIPRDQTGEFIRSIRGFIQANWPIRPNNATIFLNEVLVKATALTELAFLVDETPGVLINGFENFFINRICSFKNAKHILDEEKEIQKIISPFRIMNGEYEMDYKFVDSVDVPEIQLSDTVVGLLGKYFTFIEKKSLPTLINIRKNLSSTQIKNLELLCELINKTDKISNNLLFRITTLDSNWKSDAFLFGTKPPPHLLNDC